MKFLQVMRLDGYVSNINPDHIEYYEVWGDDSTALYFRSGRQMNINETTNSFRLRLNDFDAHSITKSLDDIDDEANQEIEKVGA